ncbi:MAG: hypothetical protein HRU70_03980 [Phycisphaeraceae bacterium]|nr:MAG: hypothetical protein HRU70_03980 [Phycisphaeraceae bacterium]
MNRPFAPSSAPTDHPAVERLGTPRLGHRTTARTPVPYTLALLAYLAAGCQDHRFLPYHPVRETAKGWSYGHDAPVSYAWPRPHPWHWAANHLAEVSLTQPRAHAPEHSATWPANHDAGISAGWDPPPNHHWANSRSYPPGHLRETSDTWGGDEHDVLVSRGWWPNHTELDSKRRWMWPPLHHAAVTGTWGHGTATSQHDWPPNHHPLVSATWSAAGHTVTQSIYYPPSHPAAVSAAWGEGPSPSWPSGHSYLTSRSWGWAMDHAIETSMTEVRPRQDRRSPISMDEDHDWFTTFRRYLPYHTGRSPWLEPTHP